MLGVIKRVSAVLFILFVMMLTVVLCASAYQPYISVGEVRTKPIRFEDSEGNEMISLEPGEVNVSATVRSLTAGKKATLVVCVYDDNEMVALETNEAAALNAGKASSLTATITVPESADSLIAFLWDDTNSLFPYTRSAVLQSNNADVTGILLDGVEIDNFDTDKQNYTVSLNPGYMTYPEIVVNTKDASTKVEITNTPFEDLFPVSNISVKNGNSQKNYTIVYEKEEPSVFGAKINVENIKNTTGVELTSASQKVTTDTLRDPAVDSPTLVFNNRTDITYEVVPENLLGATVVQVTRDLAKQLPANYDYASYGDMMEFKVNRSCEVYVNIDNPTSFPWLNANGFMVSDVKVKRWGSEVTLYKKIVYVEPGEEVTVSLGYVKGGTSEPTIIVKFLEKLPDKELIENAKLYKDTDDTFITNVSILKNIAKYSFADDTLEGTALYADSNLLNKKKAFSASFRNYYLHFCDELSGADYLKLGYTWADVTGSSSVKYYCTFELTKTATVYVNLWNFAFNKTLLYNANPWLSGYDWIDEDEGFEVGYIKDGLLITKKFGFYKTYTVDPGETVTVKVGPFINPTNASDQYTFPMIFVKAE